MSWIASVGRNVGLGSISVSALACLLLTACGGGGGGSGAAGKLGGGNNRLEVVQFGRVADVFGLRRSSKGVVVQLFQRDVLVGLDIPDERTGDSLLRDDQILFDFLTSDPDTLQPRLLITREIGSREFDDAFVKLDDKVTSVAPALFGQNGTPFGVVPRNAGIRLTFTKPLGIDDDFFVVRDANGQVEDVKNAEAVQLLQIVGDPRDSNPRGDFKVIPTRITVHGNQLLLDPVLLGTEGLRYKVRNNASGMPEAPDQIGANIRLAIALEGPLAIGGIAPDRRGNLTGKNNSGMKSVVRDFRSGNRRDQSSDISKGFLRDPIPPRLVGEILMFLESVDDVDELSQVIKLFKNGVQHEIDRGDVIRIMVGNKILPAAVTEVTVDPLDDAGKPEVQHVRVIVRRAPGLAENDPRRLPGFPADPKKREPWLVRNAPRAVLVTEFTGARRRSGGGTYGDDPRNFITFSPGPLPLKSGLPSPVNENISPFAGANIRFSKPMDIATVQALRTFFFATRDLLDPDEISAFLRQRKIDPASFVPEKFRTPHLVFSRLFDDDGSQTVLRLQPPLGFFLDEQIRQADEGKPFAEKKFRYFMHLVGGKNGIHDLSGNEIDFQFLGAVRDLLVIPFSLDTRKNNRGEPLFTDNLSVTVARQFDAVDEDEQPSYYRPDEVQLLGSPVNSKAFNLPDLFGPLRYNKGGTISARPPSRVTRALDELAQINPPNGSTQFRWCPPGTNQSRTTRTRFGFPLQNPLNPFGCRLQTAWREIDFSLSRVDPADFDLDVEQMFWAPFVGKSVFFDEFDRMTLFLGHAEPRPENCFTFGPIAPASGLVGRFADNYVSDKDARGRSVPGPKPFAAYADKNLIIDPSLIIQTASFPYLPLPKFKEPFFVWRDERLDVQGGNLRTSSDTSFRKTRPPYLLSPFLGGRGRFVSTGPNGAPVFTFGHWNNMENYRLQQTRSLDSNTGGGVGPIALALLADFWTYPDSPNLPKNNPFVAWGGNGWQISLPLPGFATPSFRVYSAGGIVQGKPRRRGPTDLAWQFASGGFTPNGAPTRSGDNSIFWTMADFQKRLTVATAGFVEILNPHRMPNTVTDPRLGPYLDRKLPNNMRPRFTFDFEPLLETLPGGTSVRVEFRGAGIVDPDPWRAKVESYTPAPNERNFPLDPRKAGDAGIRKFDDRVVNGRARNFWTYYYNRNLTSYVADPNLLEDIKFTTKFAGPNEVFQPQDVKYLNWRFIMTNNMKASPPVSPTIDSFVLTYRFEKVQ